MIDLSSKDCSYTTLKVNYIKSLLKEIKPDIKDLAHLEIINISILIFAYLLESNFFQLDEDDLILAYNDDEVILDVDKLTLELKFKNRFVNDLISSQTSKDVECLSKNLNVLSELIGDMNGF